MVDERSPGRNEGQRFALSDADVRLWPAAFEPGEASRLFDELRSGIEWQQEEVTIFGRPRLVPRLVAWHGDPDARYTYSGTAHDPLPWTPPLEAIRARLLELTGHSFNAVLLNLYRDGRDGMGWHSDDEPELGRDPVIASVSLGATRRFCMRHRRRKDSRLELPLGHGSLLLMSGPTQHHWLHAVPKTRAPVGERINLTFRNAGAR
ncbi:MAG: alpha-ketoglutarate-dependent dioxygenase AlkB [Gammaproteobacteria bacterium]|nr:alpha-ketoglutarate-dependent dioxygenase AlkB [Gammaproteobacteria bacterium]